MTTLYHNIKRHPNEATGYWLRRMRLAWLLSLTLLLMSLSACEHVTVLAGSETLTRVKAGQTVTATNDCYLVSDPMMKRILRAIQDSILEEKVRVK